MSMGWFADLADAEAYYLNERLVTDAWDPMTNALKTKAVIMGYNRIFHCGLYSVPTYALATPAQLVTLKIVNGEMAYYLAVHLADEDKRKGIQVQGTVQAGIVEESYDSKNLFTLPIPPFVAALLAPFVQHKGFNIYDLGRNENYHVYNEDHIYDHLK